MAAPTPVVSFDAAFAEYQRWIGYSRDPVVPERRGRPHKRQSIVAVSDFHIPFHSKSALRELIAREAKQTDLLVVAGDLADCYTQPRGGPKPSGRPIRAMSSSRRNAS